MLINVRKAFDPLCLCRNNLMLLKLLEFLNKTCWNVYVEKFSHMQCKKGDEK